MSRVKIDYEPGDVVIVAGVKCVVLEVEKRFACDDILFVLSMDDVGSSCFGSTDNYSKSELLNFMYQWFDEHGLFEISVPMEIDLMTNNGRHDYGVTKKFVAPLTVDEAKLYHNVIPKIGNSYWLATGQHGLEKPNDAYVMIVDPHGEIQRAKCQSSRCARPAFKIWSRFAKDIDISRVPTDVLLNELRRRVTAKKKGEENDI